MNNKSNAYGQVIKNGKQLYTEITIKATPEKVWAVLTDFSAYPSWNPFVKSIKGTPVVGRPIDNEPLSILLKRISL